MVDVLELSANAREHSGRGAARALRRGGRVPAIVYGGGEDPQNVDVDTRVLTREVDKGGFENRLVDLEVGGKTVRVLPRDVQINPVTDAPIHVDFWRLSAGAEVRVKVRAVFTNEEECPGIKRGGLVNVVRHTIEMICRVDSIPESVECDLTDLEIGDSVHISAVTLPEGVRPVIADRDFTIATISAPTVVKEEAAEAAAAALAAEGAEDLEGLEGEAVEGAEGEGEGAKDGEGDNS
jgi:large subunit ribosomal protein L25